MLQYYDSCKEPRYIFLGNSGPIWDFSIENEVTGKPLELLSANYFDAHHYRHRLGRRMLREMLVVERPSLGRIIALDNWDDYKVDQLDALRRWADSDPDTVEFLRANCLKKGATDNDLDPDSENVISRF